MLATTEDVARAGIPLYMLTGKNLALALVALFFVVRILKVASGLKVGCLFLVNTTYQRTGSLLATYRAFGARSNRLV